MKIVPVSSAPFLVLAILSSWGSVVVKAQACFPDLATMKAEVTTYLNDPANYDTTTYGPIEDWCFPAFGSLRSLFQSKTNIPTSMDISAWDVSHVTDMHGVFLGSNFNGDVSQWNVGKVRDMTYMFGGSPFNQDISNWNVESVTVGMHAMFYQAASFNSDISQWNVANSGDLSYMFYQATSFNQDLSCWNVGAANTLNAMFSGAIKFNQNLCPWGAGISTSANTNGMFGYTGCDQVGNPVLTGDPKGPFCFTCTTNNNACTAPPPPTNTCDGKSYCVAFKEVSSTLGGTGEDISLTYDASKPIDSTNSYQTTILKSDCQPFASTPTPAVSVVANSYAYSGTSTPSTMSLSLDIDTANIEGQSELTTVSTTDPNKFDVSFCVKTELMYTDTAVSSTPIEVASSKTVLTLTVNKAKDFQISITAAQEATDSKAADVTVSYPLLRCVCALGANTPTVTNGVAQCLTSYGDLNPGATFKFCIQAVNDDTNPTAVLTEVEVEALKDVNFENDGDGSGALNPALTVPIVGGTATSFGPGAGPASVDCTSTAGLCVVTAVTFAKLYEANIDSDAALEDISDHNKVKGTAILKFKTRRHLGSGSAQEEKESIEVGFVGSSAVRQLQADDGTPVDEFAMDVSLASPPDRSAAVVAGSSPTLAFVSLMMGGLLGLML